MLRDRGRNKITNTAIMIGIIEPRTPMTHTPLPIPVHNYGKRSRSRDRDKQEKERDFF